MANSYNARSKLHKDTNGDRSIQDVPKTVKLEKLYYYYTTTSKLSSLVVYYVCSHSRQSELHERKLFVYTGSKNRLGPKRKFEGLSNY
jgi:hypothetical protein